MADIIPAHTTPLREFSFKTQIVDMDSDHKTGYLYVAGRADGTWSIRLSEGQQDSRGCDTPEALWPALVEVLCEFFVKQETRNQRQVAAIMSWPDRRPGYRPGWRVKAIAEEYRHLRHLAACVMSTKNAIRQAMTKAGWPIIEDDKEPKK